MTERRIVLLLILGTAALRVAAASVGGFGIDESYLVGNSRAFSLSYVDHPPLHVWIAGAWARLTGSEDSLLLRLPFIALFAGSTWLMFRLTARLFGERAGLWAVIAFNVTPIFTLAHASWVLADGPLMFLQLAAANMLARIFFEKPSPSQAAWLWIAAGVCMGFALLAKFHGIFFLLGTFVFLLTRPDQRGWLARPAPWAGLAVAAILFSPVLIWNLTHGGAGVSFQMDRLPVASGVTLQYLPRAIGGQILFLSPWMIVPLIYVLARALRQGPASPRTWFIVLLAVGPIVVFTATALIHPGYPHWPMPGWVFTYPLLGAALVSWEQARARALYRATAAAAAVLVVIIGALLVQTANGALGRAVPQLFGRKDPTAELLDWDALRTALAERGLIDERTPAVAAGHWTEAGKANYAVGREVPVLCLCGVPQHFRFLHDPAAFAGRNMILVGSRQMMPGLLPVLAARFGRIEPLEPVIVRRGNGEAAVRLDLYRGIGLKNSPGPL